MSVETGATGGGNEGAAGGNEGVEDKANGGQQQQQETALGDGGAGNEGKSATAGKWPEDWRKLVAGDDEKEFKRLERMTSPADIYKMSRELERKISGGEYRRAAPGADAKPEDIAKWRRESGLPEKVEDYSFKFRDGFVPSDEDKALLDEFKGIAFERNLSPEISSNLAQWFLDKQEGMVAEQLEKDYQTKSEAEEELRKEFGAEYKPNMAMTKSWLEGTFGADVASQILLARGPDGRKVGNNPDVVKALTSLAREMMPGGRIVPSGSAESMAKSIGDELDAIRKVRREEPHKYWGDNAMQGRERELIGAQLKAQQGR